MGYQWKGKKRKGWINVVNPFLATMILGTQGSGKSYSIYGPYIEQWSGRAIPSLSMTTNTRPHKEGLQRCLREYERGYKVKPEFYTIGYDHPLYSHRCNPMAKRYINDPADSAEIADIIMLNVCLGKEQKNDFFDMSAKVYLNGGIYTLSQFEDGRFCTFAHLVELTTKDYKDVLRIQSHIPELGAKVATFLNPLTANAQDQLQGQIASTTIQYIPSKTKEENPRVVKVYLAPTAIEIMNRNQGKSDKGLFPFVSTGKLNDLIRVAMKQAGITRVVTIVNPVTKQSEQHPICDVASSHMARRTFIGNLYKKVKGPNLVGKLSGHCEGSKAFARYRDIDDDMIKEMTSLLD